MIKTLLSLPPNLVEHFHQITGLSRSEWFCASDPLNARLGSGGGTAWLLESCRQSESPETPLPQWLSHEKRILLHAGGQGRRIPAYAPSGKILTPIPVFRWERGQHLDQTLLDFQLPLYRQIMEKAPASLHTLIASGDVLIRAEEIPNIPEADVVCFGLWEEPSLAKNHGVFMMRKNHPEQLDFMLQKPSSEELNKWMSTHFFLMDIGIWILSDRAVELLCSQATDSNGELTEYDLYSEFGCALGHSPSRPANSLSDLSVAILSLPKGEFYHYGTSHELLSSTATLMNLVKDQRFILQQNIKNHPSIFTQNSVVRSSLLLQTPHVWIENSFIPETWKLSAEHILTGIPENNWTINLLPSQCVDIVPLEDDKYVLRPYGFNDAFRGATSDSATTFLNMPITEWMESHHVSSADFVHNDDLQQVELFPICSLNEIEPLLVWFLQPQEASFETTLLWQKMPRISAEEISNRANLLRLEQQRKTFREKNLPTLAKNFRKSVFYQLDLNHTAHLFAQSSLPLPPELPQDAPFMTQIHDAMFRAEYLRMQNQSDAQYYQQAFSLLRRTFIEQMQSHPSLPHLDVYPDQIVWARSAVRIDIAGGWTDTPPYSLLTGGSVVNMAVQLGGQQPLQVYLKPNKEFHIVCRSIDLGTAETFETFEDLRSCNQVGSPFSIPKAALALAGFLPEFCSRPYASLRQQLEDFGSGFDITLLSAVPAGSGLGTSSILAATLLGALSDFCGLHWTKNEIGNRTLTLEQMLTTGGGWQDQFGGILHGIKHLQTSSGIQQKPAVSWLPDNIFRQEDYRVCHLLYYTGITRTAKQILAEIVRGMFLNNATHLSLLHQMKHHASALAESIMRSNFEEYGKLVRTTWEQNKRLDSGTCPPTVAKLCDTIDDLALGYKLPGAGGGGFLYIVAKDPQAAALIRTRLQTNPITPSARFVDLTLSEDGLKISRS